jgi:hypothetical protein
LSRNPRPLGRGGCHIKFHYKGKVVLDLLEMLFSWSGLLTLIIIVYVIDDVAALGIKPRVRELIGRHGVLNKDPDVVLLEREFARLEKMIVELKSTATVAPDIKKSSRPLAESKEVKNPIPPTPAGTQKWTSWVDRKSSES